MCAPRCQPGANTMAAPSVMAHHANDRPMIGLRCSCIQICTPCAQQCRLQNAHSCSGAIAALIYRIDAYEGLPWPPSHVAALELVC